MSLLRFDAAAARMQLHQKPVRDLNEDLRRRGAPCHGKKDFAVCKLAQVMAQGFWDRYSTATLLAQLQARGAHPPATQTERWLLVSLLADDDTCFEESTKLASFTVAQLVDHMARAQIPHHPCSRPLKFDLVNHILAHGQMTQVSQALSQLASVGPSQVKADPRPKSTTPVLANSSGVPYVPYAPPSHCELSSLPDTELKRRGVVHHMASGGPASEVAMNDPLWDVHWPPQQDICPWYFNEPAIPAMLREQSKGRLEEHLDPGTQRLGWASDGLMLGRLGTGDGEHWRSTPPTEARYLHFSAMSPKSPEACLERNGTVAFGRAESCGKAQSSTSGPDAESVRLLQSASKLAELQQGPAPKDSALRCLQTQVDESRRQLESTQSQLTSKEKLLQDVTIQLNALMVEHTLLQERADAREEDLKELERHRDLRTSELQSALKAKDRDLEAERHEFGRRIAAKDLEIQKKDEEWRALQSERDRLARDCADKGRDLDISRDRLRRHATKSDDEIRGKDAEIRKLKVECERLREDRPTSTVPPRNPPGPTEPGLTPAQNEKLSQHRQKLCDLDLMALCDLVQIQWQSQKPTAYWQARFAELLSHVRQRVQESSLAPPPPQTCADDRAASAAPAPARLHDEPSATCDTKPPEDQFDALPPGAFRQDEPADTAAEHCAPVPPAGCDGEADPTASLADSTQDRDSRPPENGQRMAALVGPQQIRSADGRHQDAVDLAHQLNACFQSPPGTRWYNSLLGRNRGYKQRTLEHRQALDNAIRGLLSDAPSPSLLQGLSRADQEGGYPSDWLSDKAAGLKAALGELGELTRALEDGDP
ncbi:hypothetical protein A1O7_06966 [Cladophialophora yegresii CBS 114405]|uniref:Uncharacterized protein n=1 Tax=Cladophialophora yegresii CBS 114405 TaxID=1182544 RepID=W9VLN5_9EURO|nr:uncharacterized protein A1O7_06966 [Cladophialophora yegresii CBS 114405]EXJ56622.1 hypothetical protein A1O7_06966 [Cladophialophora yegresii CBS 114405]